MAQQALPCISAQLLSPETTGSQSQNGVVLAAPQVVPLFGDVALGEAEDALSNKLRNHTSYETEHASKTFRRFARTLV